MSDCFYCGRKISRKKKTKDHVIPKSRRGSSRPSNIVDACKPCNCLKGCLTLEEFRLVIAFQKGLLPCVRMRFPGELKELRKN